MTGCYQDTATVPGLQQCSGGSQNSPAAGQVLLSETPSMEIWRAGADPAVSLWLWWLGSHLNQAVVFAQQEQSEAEGPGLRGKGAECSGRAVRNIPGCASSLLWPPQRLQQVAASVSLCPTGTGGCSLTICGYFDVLFPGTG